MTQISKYKVPKSITIPVPDLNKPRQEKASRPTSVLSNFDLPVYEELGGPKEEQLKRCSRSMTPGLAGMKYGEGAIPKDSSKGKPAFQDYTSKMMSALNNPWKPQSKRTATPTWLAVPPLVYVSAAGTPVDDTGSKQGTNEKYVPVNFSAVDKTVLTPQGRQKMEGVTSPIKFTEDLQNGDALKVNPQGGALMEALGFGPNKVEKKDPDFYMPDGQGKRLSETYQMFTNEQTPEGNPGVIVKLTNLVKKYGSHFYLMDKKSGHLYVLHEQGYMQIEEKGLLYPSKSLKGSTNYGLTKERVTQVQSSGTWGSQGPVRVQNPPGNGGGGDSPGGTSGDQRFPGEGRGPPGRNNNQAGGGGDDDPDPSDDGDGDDSSSTDFSAPRKRKHKSPKYVYVIQGPPGPKGQEGQPGQAGRDGRDGQNFTLKELETLRAHRPNLDTTGLENSFDQFGQTMFEVLNAQHRTNQKLEEQFRRAIKQKLCKIWHRQTFK